MRYWCAIVLATSFLICAADARTSQHESFRDKVQTITAAQLVAANKGLDPLAATLDNPAAAGLLINGLLVTKDKNKPTYCIVHLLRWADGSTPDKPKIQSQTFYLYRYDERGWSQEDFTTNKRIFGASHVAFLFVHFNAAGMIGKYVPEYDFTITKKTPANVAHLYALLSSFAPGATPQTNEANTAELRKPQQAPDAIWGGGLLDLQYIPSDIALKSTFRTGSGQLDNDLSQTQQKLADDIIYDNEGRYYWDVGFAIPVRRISEIKLDATSGVATPAQVNSTNVFAVFNGYIPSVDVKGNGFTRIPHPIAGVDFGKQPLRKILVGGAWGPHLAELYMGAVFVKQRELSGSTSCSDPSGTSVTGKSHYCTQFAIGINVSVSAIAGKLGAPK